MFRTMCVLLAALPCSIDVFAVDGDEGPRTEVAHLILRLAEKADSAVDRAATLNLAAELLAMDGRREEARDAWSRAVDSASEVPDARALFQIGMAEVRQREFEAARVALDRAREAASEMPEGQVQIAMFGFVLRQQRLAGDEAGARDTLALGMKILEAPKDLGLRMWREDRRGELLGAAGDFRGLARLVVECEPHERTGIEGSRMTLLTRLAAEVKREPNPEGITILDEAGPLVYGLTKHSYLLQTLLAFAWAEAEVGHVDHALRYLETAPDLGSNRTTEAYCRLAVASALAKAGRRDEAREMLASALRAADAFKEQEVVALRGLIPACALAQAGLGDLDEARATFKKLEPGWRGKGVVLVAGDRARAGDAAGANALWDDLRRDSEARLAELAGDEPPHPPTPFDRSAPAELVRLDLVTALARLGDLDAAGRVAGEIPEGPTRHEALANIALARADAGALHALLTWGESSKTPLQTAHLLYTFARGQALPGAGRETR